MNIQTGKRKHNDNSKIHMPTSNSSGHVSATVYLAKAGFKHLFDLLSLTVGSVGQYIYNGFLIRACHRMHRIL